MSVMCKVLEESERQLEQDAKFKALTVVGKTGQKC